MQTDTHILNQIKPGQRIQCIKIAQINTNEKERKKVLISHKYRLKLFSLVYNRYLVALFGR